VGKPLVRYLESCGYEVLSTDIKPGWRSNYLMADINHPIDLMPAFDWGPDVVFALSAVVSRVTCEQASGLAISTNLGGINNLIQMCKRVDARMVYVSTSEVYGPDLPVMDETMTDLHPNNRYGLSKLLGEKLVEYEVEHNDLKAVTLRPFMIYDENEDLGDHRSAMIRFVSNLVEGVPIEVHNGSARGWLHVSDAVRAVEAAARAEEYSVINIGHPDIVAIEDLAERIRTSLDAPEELVEYVDLPVQMTSVKNPTLERMSEILGVTPLVGLDEGLDRVCERVKERLATSNVVSVSGTT
jgi:nucleoside-diphosphate-sugar epimerase